MIWPQKKKARNSWNLTNAPPSLVASMLPVAWRSPTALIQITTNPAHLDVSLFHIHPLFCGRYSPFTCRWGINISRCMNVCYDDLILLVSLATCQVALLGSEVTRQLLVLMSIQGKKSQASIKNNKCDCSLRCMCTMSHVLSFVFSLPLVSTSLLLFFLII